MREDRTGWAGINAALLRVGRVCSSRYRTVIWWWVRGVLHRIATGRYRQAATMSCTIVEAGARDRRRRRSKARACWASRECCGCWRAEASGRLRVVGILLARAASDRVVRVDAHHGTFGRVVRHCQRCRPTSEVFWYTDTRGCRANTRGRQVPTVPSAVTSALTVHGIRTWPTVSWWTNPVGPDLTLKPCTRSRKRITRNILVDVHSLRMLAEVVEARESA